MTLIAIVAGPLLVTPGAVALFAVASVITLCAGHSVGLHRGLIHRSYRTHVWFERALVYLATLVGKGGPVAMMRMHHTRDRAQNQPRCHDFFGHRRAMWRDYLWQVHGQLVLETPFDPPIEAAVSEDPFYRWLDRTWMVQQVPIAVACYLAGGWSFVVWGVCVRVAVGCTGHWFVGHLAHRVGRQYGHCPGAAVQGFNVPLWGLLSFGEGWHNNHHLFPRSARMGLGPYEFDLGWVFLRAFARLGLVWDLREASLPVGAVSYSNAIVTSVSEG